MTLRIGIVGCGKIADSHVDQARATGRAEVVACCDREPLMAEQLAVRHNIPAWTTDLAKMLAEQRLDVLHIATPPDSHLPLVRMATDAGVHVFVEKPVATTGAQTREMFALAERAGRKIAVNYLLDFEWPSMELKDLLEQGALGDIVHVDATFGYDLAGEYGVAVLSDPTHWVHLLPGKLFHNVLDHLVCKLAMVMPLQTPVVRAYVKRARPAIGNAVIDDLGDELRVFLESGGVTANLLISARAKPTAHTMTVYGSKERVHLDYLGRTLVRGQRQTQSSALGRLFPAFVQARAYWAGAWRNVGRFRRAEFHFFQGLRALLSGFYDSIERGTPPPVPHEQVLWSAEAIDAIVEAMAQFRAEQRRLPGVPS